MSIKIKKLNHIYSEGTPFKKQALKDVDLEIKSGEFIGLIGHTGSGKSTLIQHINRLLKPKSGLVIVDDQDINDAKLHLKNVRQKVGLVFQYPEHQLFETTVYNDVAFGPKNMGIQGEALEKRIAYALSKVGLGTDYYEKSPFELSGGQKRRVAIAGVLAMKPKILILDEPTAGLDPKGRDEILDEIKKLHDEEGITIILVSHSMEDIAKYVNRIVVMDKGEIRLDDTNKNVFMEIDLLESMGLAAPNVTYLMRALNKRGIAVSEEVITIDEAYIELSKLFKKINRISGVLND